MRGRVASVCQKKLHLIECISILVSYTQLLSKLAESPNLAPDIFFEESLTTAILARDVPSERLYNIGFYK
jgi:hypothetical protein